MSLFQIIISILSVLIAAAGTFIAQWLQKREARRKDKMEIFKMLMMNRHCLSPDCVRALNIIEVVFADDASVCAAWKAFLEKSCVENPSEAQRRQTKNAWDKLLETMAVSLGYKEQITWETIQNPYVPQK